MATLLGVPVRADSRVPRGYIVYAANGRVWLVKVPALCAGDTTP